MSDLNVVNFSFGGLHFHLSRRAKEEVLVPSMAIPPGCVPIAQVERQYDDKGKIAVYVLVEDQGRPDGEPGLWYVNAIDPRKWMTAQSLARRKMSGKDAGWVSPSIKVD